MTDIQDTRTSGGDFQRLMQKAANHRLLDREEERSYIRRAQRGEPGALDELTELNVRLILHAANKYRAWGASRGLMIGDLFSHAAIGFQKGVKKFKLSKKVRLSTYVGWWMRHEIVRCIEDTGRTIRIPVHTQQKMNKLDRASRKFRTEHGREPTLDELAAESKVAKKQIAALKDAPLEPVSLDAVIPGTDMEVIDFCADRGSSEKTAFDELAEHADALRLADALKELSEIERRVLECRYTEEMTLVATAKELVPLTRWPLSRERIRQIQNEAIAKLRKAIVETDTSM